MAKKKKSYHFSMGDSSTGPVGLCARIVATSKKKAVERLHDLLEQNTTDMEVVSVFDEGPEYINVYVNTAAMTEADIDEEDEADDDDGG